MRTQTAITTLALAALATSGCSFHTNQSLLGDQKLPPKLAQEQRPVVELAVSEDVSAVKNGLVVADPKTALGHYAQELWTFWHSKGLIGRDGTPDYRLTVGGSHDSNFSDIASLVSFILTLNLIPVAGNSTIAMNATLEDLRTGKAYTVNTVENGSKVLVWLPLFLVAPFSRGSLSSREDVYGYIYNELVAQGAF